MGTQLLQKDHLVLDKPQKRSLHMQLMKVKLSMLDAPLSEASTCDYSRRAI